MSNANLVVLMGRLTRDPELRFTPQGTAVCDVSLAINHVSSNQDGTKREEVTFVDVTLWAKTAENVAKYMKKGSGVYIQGRLHLDRWQDAATGQNRQKLKVVGSMVQFLPRGGGAPSEAPQETSDEDVPF